MYDLKLAQKKHQLPMQFVWFQAISQSAFYHMIRLIIYTSFNIQTIQKNWFECTIMYKNFKWWINQSSLESSPLFNKISSVNFELSLFTKLNYAR